MNHGIIRNWVVIIGVCMHRWRYVALRLTNWLRKYRIDSFDVRRLGDAQSRETTTSNNARSITRKECFGELRQGGAEVGRLSWTNRKIIQGAVDIVVVVIQRIIGSLGPGPKSLMRRTRFWTNLRDQSSMDPQTSRKKVSYVAWFSTAASV